MACCDGKVPEPSKSCGSQGEKKDATAETLFPEAASKKSAGGAGTGSGCENGGCKCGPTCNCNPCTCK